MIGRVRRLVDLAVEERLRDARANLGAMTARSQALERLEAALNGLSDGDLGAMMAKFFDAVEDLSLNPASMPARRQVVAVGSAMADRFRSLADELRQARDRLNDEVNLQVGEINRMLEEIAQLNGEILVAENGGLDVDRANDLRDRREHLVQQLAERIAVKAVETSTGQLNVLAGSSFLVFGTQASTLDVVDRVDLKSAISEVVFADGSGIVQVNGGQLRGLLDARDGSVRGVLRDLNVLANAFAREVNTVHASGTPLERYRRLTGERGVLDPAAPLAFTGSATQDAPSSSVLRDSTKTGFAGTLIGRQILILSGENALERRTIVDFDPATGTMFLDQPFLTPVRAGDRYQVTDLPMEIRNGTFEFVVTNEVTGSQTKATIHVNVLNDPATSDTLASVAAQIGAVDPAITATVLPDGRLRIESANDNVRFSFAEDTTGLLAALGMAGIFSGSGTFDLGINADLEANPRRLAAGRSTDEGDSSNAIALLNLRGRPLVDGRESFEAFLQSVIGRVGVETSDFQQRREAAALATQQLENQRQRISGVNIDEEAIQMLTFQRAFQASARFVVVVDNLLETLISMV
jgi:flagellar hook-associated protein 1 FlgK